MSQTQNKPKSTSAVIVLEQRQVMSTAWLSLEGAAHAVYLLLRCECHPDQNKKRAHAGRAQTTTFTNDRELVLTYAQAESYGITAGRFRRAVDQLVDRGFIDIVRSGYGLHQVATLYGLSERWKDWNTDAFEPSERPKPRQYNGGFRPGNQHGRNCGQNNTHVMGVGLTTNTTVMDVGQSYLVVFTGVGQKIRKTRYKMVNGRWLGRKSA